MRTQKTNAMRTLDKNQLSYEVSSYAYGKEAVASLDIAKQLEENPEQTFKTLVTAANTKEYIVFVILVAHELHLKGCVRAAGVKPVEMIHVKDINKVTDHIRRGYSLIGVERQSRTFVYESCIGFPIIAFSSGKIGVQIRT